MADFESIAEKTFNFEGGFQANPSDTANYYPSKANGELIGTNKGISAVAYGTYLGRKPTVEEIKAITTDIAKDVYKKNFWNKYIDGDSIKNQSVAHLMFDFIIASGQAVVHDIKMIMNQTAGKNIVSENNNPFTASEISILNGLNQSEFHANLKRFRLIFVDAIIKNNPDLEQFRKGWTNRINDLVFVEESEAEKKKL